MPAVLSGSMAGASIFCAVRGRVLCHVRCPPIGYVLREAAEFSACASVKTRPSANTENTKGRISVPRHRPQFLQARLYWSTMHGKSRQTMQRFDTARGTLALAFKAPRTEVDLRIATTLLTPRPNDSSSARWRTTLNADWLSPFDVPQIVRARCGLVGSATAVPL